MKIRHFLGIIRNQMIKIFNLFPLQDAIIFESNPDFNDEGYWMCKKFMDKEMDGKYKIYWYLKDRNAKGMPREWEGRIDFIYLHPKNLGEWIKKYYVLHTSKVILDSCLFVPKSRKKQFRLFLFHGMPIKKVDKYMSGIGNFDYLSAGSHYFTSYYESLGISKDKMIFEGLIRNDQLKESKSIIKHLFDIDNVNNVVIWMPTYRQHITSDTAANIKFDNNNETGMPVLTTYSDFVYINERLKQMSILLIIKPHQSQDLSFMAVNELTNIKILKTNDLEINKIQLYSVLADTSAIITDYSSIYIDYLLLNKPIALTVDDLEIYEKEVGFAVNYREDVKGVRISTRQDFEDFLTTVAMEKDDFERMSSLTLFHDVLDFSSGERIFNFIIKKGNLHYKVK